MSTIEQRRPEKAARARIIESTDAQILVGVDQSSIARAACIFL